MSEHGFSNAFQIFNLNKDITTNHTCMSCDGLLWKRTQSPDLHALRREDPFFETAFQRDD